MRFSVIIPAYNGAQHLSEAIRSVQAQSLDDWELLVVDDCSTDQSVELVQDIDDSRVRLIRHETNRGANAARNTGVRAARGELLAFLDQDDYFHPDKLSEHDACWPLGEPAGFSYNARFELDHGAATIRGFWQPPAIMRLDDLLLGFPLSPSDMVVSRDWVLQAGLWDEDVPVVHGGEMTFAGRLFLAGCSFRYVNRALNYRRYHPERSISRLAVKCKAEKAAQTRLAQDPRCPPSVAVRLPEAHFHSHMIWAYLALRQEETGLARSYLEQALAYEPGLVRGRLAPLVRFWVDNVTADDSLTPEGEFERILAQLPAELHFLTEQFELAVALSYLGKGITDVVWGRLEKGRQFLTRAADLGAAIDDATIRRLVHELLLYAREFGAIATDSVVANLQPPLVQLGGVPAVRRLKALLAINQAYLYFEQQRYRLAATAWGRAALQDPRHLARRGSLALLIRSALAGIGLAAVGVTGRRAALTAPQGR